ncbi:MAG: hypothetical protein HY223_06040 [Thaumarchaeota archaeon]|nr:hypothetical protein [Nitrososphaerota archaeon]
MSKNIKELDNKEKIDSSYDDMVKKEKRLSWIVTFGVPIPMFILIIIISVTKNSSFLPVVFVPFAIFFIIISSLVFLPTDKRYSARNPVRSASVFFNKVRYERMVIRWKIWSDCISKYVQFMIFVGAYVAVMVSILSLVKIHSDLVDLMKNFLYSLLIVPAIMLFIPFSFRSALNKHNDFGQCYSIGCFRMVTKFKTFDDIKQTSYIIDGLKYYDYYIRKNLNLRINNFETFYSLILKDSRESMNVLSQTILTKLEKGEKLDLLRYLISQSTVSEDKPFLVSEKMTNKIKNSYQLIIAITSLTIALIQLAK